MVKGHKIQNKQVYRRRAQLLQKWSTNVNKTAITATCI